MKKIFSPRFMVRIKNRLIKTIEKVRRFRWELLAGKPVRRKRAFAPSTLRKAVIKKPPVMPFQSGEELAPAAGGRFSAGLFTDLAGSLKYHLFIPSTYQVGMPLLVMLHGCKQDADMFAIGTRMNEHAERLGLLVLYPEQSGMANLHKCWNWFKPVNQFRNMGEPAVIAAMTKRIIGEYEIDAHKVYIAGLSAGAAMAYIVGTAYAEMFAAIGMHSGLSYRGIHNMFAAMAAMKAESDPSAVPEDAPDEFNEVGAAQDTQRLIVFHGDNDTVVNAHNADKLMARHYQKKLIQEHRGEESAQPYGYTRTLYQTDTGKTWGEQWIIHGAGHAWSGGNPKGSFTDAKGPDASREMLRFFCEST